jgi:hypothetical protein
MTLNLLSLMIIFVLRLTKFMHTKSVIHLEQLRRNEAGRPRVKANLASSEFEIVATSQ